MVRKQVQALQKELNANVMFSLDSSWKHDSKVNQFQATTFNILTTTLDTEASQLNTNWGHFAMATHQSGLNQLESRHCLKL